MSKTEAAIQSVFRLLLSERDLAKNKGEFQRAKLLNETITLICDTRDKYRKAVSTHK